MIEIQNVVSQAYTSAVLKIVDAKGRTFFLRIDPDRLVLNTKADFTGRHAYVSADDLFGLAKDQGRQPFGKAKTFRPKDKAVAAPKPLKLGKKVG